MALGVRAHQIERVQLNGIRGFANLDLSVVAEGSPRRSTILIGKNGTCKTTLLRAIALGLAHPVDAQGLIAEPIGGMISAGRESAKLEIGLAGKEPHLLIDFKRTLSRKGGLESIDLSEERISVHSNVQPPTDLPEYPFVVGYGAGRYGPGISPETDRSYRASDGVATLFRYDRALFGPELILRRLRDVLGENRFPNWLHGIQRVLGLAEEEAIVLRSRGGVAVRSASAGGEVPLEAWADGYRLTLNWLLDLYGWAMRAEAIDEEGHISGILLIDEIEQHLHPSLQAEILPRLTELLPKMQIFATTHSPLVVLDAKPEEVVVLRREGETVVAEPHIPDFRGYSAEDVLIDPRLFDTPEVYGSEKRQSLEQYRELSAIPPGRRSARESSELKRLATELQGQAGPESRESEVVRELRELVAKGRL